VSEEEQINDLANSFEASGLKVQISDDKFEIFENELIYVKRDVSDNSLEFSDQPWASQQGFDTGNFVGKYFIASPSRDGQNLYIIEYLMDWKSMEYLEDTDQYKWETDNRQVAFFRPDGWKSVREYS
jgi:hypothetical protein